MPTKSANVPKKSLTAAEIALFRESVGDIQKVTTDKVLLKSGRKPSPRPKQQQSQAMVELTRPVDLDIVTVSPEDTLSFLSPGLQKNILAKMRKGHFGLDAELDLHGLTSNAAKQQLLRFLQQCVDVGCRCVHIIHGKGYRSADNHPVLKNHLNQWLRQHHDVQAFCSATQREGGAGAVMVLLHVNDKFKTPELDH